MFNPFSWVRRQAEAAFVGGVADGMARLVPDGEAIPAGLDELRGRVAAAVQALPPAAGSAESPEAPAKVKSRVKA